MNVYVQNYPSRSARTGSPRHLVPGRETIPPYSALGAGRHQFSEVVTALQAIGYDGYFTVHQAYAELMGPQEAAIKSADYLRSLGGFEQ